jgi:hypothetical protein
MHHLGILRLDRRTRDYNSSRPYYGSDHEIFLETFATGQYSVRQATDLAFELGIKSKKGTKRTWQTVENTLKNPIYAGYIESKYTNGKRYVGLHKGLISDDIFEKNLRILAGKHRIFIKTDEQGYPLRRISYVVHIATNSYRQRATW